MFIVNIGLLDIIGISLVIIVFIILIVSSYFEGRK